MAYSQSRAQGAENVFASALIYLPSHRNDFKVPEVRKYLEPYVRGSNNYGAEERVKLMKLVWDALGSEFGSRHALYERNYFGNHENIRTEVVMVAEAMGQADKYRGFAEQRSQPGCIVGRKQRGFCHGLLARRAATERRYRRPVRGAGGLRTPRFPKGRGFIPAQCR